MVRAGNTKPTTFTMCSEPGATTNITFTAASEPGATKTITSTVLSEEETNKPLLLHGNDRSAVIYNGHGVGVLSIKSGSPLSTISPALQSGDYIVAINGETLSGVEGGPDAVKANFISLMTKHRPQLNLLVVPSVILGKKPGKPSNKILKI